MTMADDTPGAVSVLTLSEPRIDYQKSADFRDQLFGALAARPGSLVIDFAGVISISSVGLRALVAASKQAKAAGRQIVIAGLQPLVREVFRISGFDRLIPVYADLEAAHAALAAPPAP
jgi:anti-anti-sigma factor